MTTTTDTTIDFSVWTKEEEVKPRTLREIEREVGFPFAAKAVREGNCIISFPLGSIATFTGWSGDNAVSPHPRRGSRSGWGTHADYPRWILLGDKT